MTNAQVHDTAVFAEVAQRYAQEQTTLDPQQLQVGQSVFDQMGEEFMILEDPEGTTDKVLMPNAQSGSAMPEGVVTVEDADLAATYGLQPQGAQGATGVGVVSRQMFAGYADFLDSRYDDDAPVNADAPIEEDLGSYNPGEEGAGEWVNQGAPYVERFDPTMQDQNQGTETKAPEMSGPLNPDDKPRHGAIHMDIGGLMPGSSDLQQEDDSFILGQSGYTDIMNDIKAMVDSGYGTVDVILNIGELYERDIGERVLAEARKKGIL